MAFCRFFDKLPADRILLASVSYNHYVYVIIISNCLRFLTDLLSCVENAADLTHPKILAWRPLYILMTRYAPIWWRNPVGTVPVWWPVLLQAPSPSHESVAESVCSSSRRQRELGRSLRGPLPVPTHPVLASSFASELRGDPAPLLPDWSGSCPTPSGDSCCQRQTS